MPSHFMNLIKEQTDLESIINVIKENIHDVDKPDENGMTLLLWAAREGYREIVEYLIQHAGGIVTSPAGKMAFEDALRNRHPEVAKILVNAGVPLGEASEPQTIEALSLAVNAGYLGVVKAIFTQYPSFLDDRGLTNPLIAAALNQHHQEIVEWFFLEQGVTFPLNYRAFARRYHPEMNNLFINLESSRNTAWPRQQIRAFNLLQTVEQALHFFTHYPDKVDLLFQNKKAKRFLYPKLSPRLLAKFMSNASPELVEEKKETLIKLITSAELNFFEKIFCLFSFSREYNERKTQLAIQRFIGHLEEDPSIEAKQALTNIFLYGLFSQERDLDRIPDAQALAAAPGNLKKPFISSYLNTMYELANSALSDDDLANAEQYFTSIKTVGESYLIKQPKNGKKSIQKHVHHAELMLELLSQHDDDYHEEINPEEDSVVLEYQRKVSFFDLEDSEKAKVNFADDSIEEISQGNLSRQQF